MNLRLVTYNLLSEESVQKKNHFRHLKSMNRQEIQANILSSLDADLIMLQEYNPKNCEIIDRHLEQNGYQIIKQLRSHFHINATVIRKNRLKVIWANQKKSRGLIIALEDLETRDIFITINVHLDCLDDIARNNQISSYIEVSRNYFYDKISVYCDCCEKTINGLNIEAHNSSSKHKGDPITVKWPVVPVIWSGDFNQISSYLENVFPELKRVEVNYATHWSGRTIDHIFFDPSCFRLINIFDTKYLGFNNLKNPSDHLPIIIELGKSPSPKGD